MDNPEPKPNAGILSKLYNGVGNFAYYVAASIPGYQLPPNGVPPSSSTTVGENGVHTRRITESEEPHPELLQNVFEILIRGRELSGNGPCVGVRPLKKGKYEWLSYQNLIDRATNFGAGLLTLGGKADCEYLIGIFAKTCLDWTVAEYGCFAHGMATAPLYDSLGPEACQATVNLYDIEIMVCGADEQVAALLSGDKFPSKLRTIITIDQLKLERIAQLESLGVQVRTVAQVEEAGVKNPRPLGLASGDSLATLIFTSGTTGPPKGAMLTHSCILLAIKSFVQTATHLRLSPSDTALGAFPLSHILERIAEKLVHQYGGKVGYVRDDVRSMFSDAQELHPTLFFFVPRLMNRFSDEVQTDIERSFLGRTLGRLGLAAKMRNMKNGIFTKDTIWDVLLFRKYQEMLGGCIRASFVGSAASDGNVLNFVRAVLGVYIFEMYGQTEGCGPCSCSPYGDITTGHVGVPFADVEVKLVDVPEMGYFAADQRGEICSRSKCTMRGYYRMPEKTAETIDEDNWLHTGDIGMWTEDGKLKIFDRKKHIFKLSQGEYLAPERLEGVFGRSNLITNIFVDGDSKYPYAVALIYPNYDALEVSPSQITHDGRKTAHEAYIREKIMEDLVRWGKEGKLKSYEVPKKFAILEEPFSVDNNCLTPSLKTKREAVRTLYRDRIRELYESD